MSVRQCSHIPSRLAMVAGLQFPVLYWIYKWLYGVRFTGHSYFPSDPFLLEAAVSATALVIIFPVLLRGDAVQKVLGGVLMPLPLMLFGIAVYWVVWIFRWTRS